MNIQEKIYIRIEHAPKIPYHNKFYCKNRKVDLIFTLPLEQRVCHLELIVNVSRLHLHGFFEMTNTGIGYSNISVMATTCDELKLHP